MAINFALWNTSLFYTNVANAAMLGNISPLWVSIGAILLFREHLKKQFWMGLLTILLGIILIMGEDFFIHPHLGFGDILATSASIFSAAYILITQWGRKKLEFNIIYLDQRSQCLHLVVLYHYDLSRPSGWFSSADLDRVCGCRSYYPDHWLHGYFVLARSFASIHRVTNIEFTTCISNYFGHTLAS